MADLKQPHQPSFWLGAHLTLFVIALLLAPLTGGWTLGTAALSSLCIWSNWSANFAGERA